MLKSFKILFAILVINTSSFCQEKLSVVKLFDNVEKFYQNQKYYSYTSQYKFYSSLTATTAIEEYSGTIIKKDKVSYQKINKVEMLDFGDYNAIINHEEKTVQINSIENNNSPIALKAFLKIFPTKKVMEDKNFWICELTSGKLQMSQFSKLIIYINKKDYSLYKEVFYMDGNQEIEKNKKKIKLKDPRLEVVFIANKKNPEKENQITAKENYFSIKNKQIILSKRFKTYKLITL